MELACAAAPALAAIALAGFGAGARPSFAAPPVEATAGWSTGTVVEPETVEQVPAALVEGSSGLVLAIAREPGGERVMGILRLAATDQDFLDESRPPLLQVDDGPRFEPRRQGGSLKSVTFSLWDGVGEPVHGPLRDLMDARERILVVYPLAGGGHKEIVLAAAGAGRAIAQVLGVAEEVTPQARALAVAQQEAVERCLAGWSKPKERDRCLERLAACGEAATAEDLKSCLTAGRKR